jgi:hypothetical protein
MLMCCISMLKAVAKLHPREAVPKRGTLSAALTARMNACPDTNRTSPRAAKYGSVHWVVPADVNKGHYATTAPLVGRNHVLVGISSDLDNSRDFLRSIDPESRETGTRHTSSWHPSQLAALPG